MLGALAKMSYKSKSYHRLGTESPEDSEKQSMIDEVPVRFIATPKRDRWLLSVLTVSVLLNIGLAFFSGRTIIKDHAITIQCESVTHEKASNHLEHVKNVEHVLQTSPELQRSEFGTYPSFSHEMYLLHIAGLVYDQPVEWIRGHPLQSTDLKAANKTWQETIDIDPGVIALHKTYAASHGLPHSSQFAWDDDKEIYYINGIPTFTTNM
jgi:hypothetical protein